MIKIEKQENVFGYSFNIHLDNGVFTIMFAGNLDLYWHFHSRLDLNDKKIKITQENSFLYSLFKELYESIKLCEFDSVFDKKTIISLGMKRYNKFLDNDHKLFKEGVVEWHSDDAPYEEANTFQIKKLDDEYEVIFNEGKNHLEMFNSGVRISNSGSRYQYFNLLFMHMYNKLIEYDNEFDQVTLDEYFYELKKLRKKDNHVSL